jgi:hypothetical protein
MLQPFDIHLPKASKYFKKTSKQEIFYINNQQKSLTMSKFKQPATVVTSFYEGIESTETIPDEDTLGFDIDSFSSMSMEAVYILDFQKRCFHYVSNHELFLCGYPQQEVMRLGYDFYPKTVHPDDFLQFKKIHNVILKLLRDGDEDEPVEDINYFSFTLRLKNRLQLL